MLEYLTVESLEKVAADDVLKSLQPAYSNDGFWPDLGYSGYDDIDIRVPGAPTPPNLDEYSNNPLIPFKLSTGEINPEWERLRTIFWTDRTDWQDKYLRPYYDSTIDAHNEATRNLSHATDFARSLENKFTIEDLPVSPEQLGTGGVGLLGIAGALSLAKRLRKPKPAPPPTLLQRVGGALKRHPKLTALGGLGALGAGAYGLASRNQPEEQ